MKKVKVLYLIPHLQNKGPVAQLFSLIKNIDVNQFSLSVLTIFPERENSMIEQFKSLGVDIVCGNLNKWQVLSQKTLVRKTINTVKPDIIHSCSTITDGICAAIKFEQPLIITLHNNIYEDVVVQYGKLIGGYLAWQEKRAIIKANCVVTCSNTLKKQYEVLIPRDYIAIPNGIEIEKWVNNTGLDKYGLREKLGLPQDKFIIISTGALIDRKNPLIIIEAFKEARLENAVLLMLGDGTLLEQCKKAANGRVIFTGRVNNVKEYLYASDLLISASNAEGLPYAILEAECTGIKMLLSDIPQHREALGDNSEMVNYFEVSGKAELKHLIELGVLGGFEKVNYNINKISAQTMAEKYMVEYMSLR